MKNRSNRPAKYTIGEAFIANNFKVKANVEYRPLHEIIELPNRVRSVAKIKDQLAKNVVAGKPFAERRLHRWNKIYSTALKQNGGENPLTAKQVHRRVNRYGEKFLTVATNLTYADGTPVIFEYPE